MMIQWVYVLSTSDLFLQNMLREDIYYSNSFHLRSRYYMILINIWHHMVLIISLLHIVCKNIINNYGLYNKIKNRLKVTCLTADSSFTLPFAF